MLLIYLLLGSNMGNRTDSLRAARDFIEDRIGQIEKYSPIYETAAWGKVDQPAFLNQVIAVNSKILDPQIVLTEILAIEKNLGRIRDEKWGQRIIDIDILFFGDLILEDNNLIIPHPQLQNRMFTLAPLKDLAPNFVHPVLHLTISQLIKICKDNLLVRKYY